MASLRTATPDRFSLWQAQSSLASGPCGSSAQSMFKGRKRLSSRTAVTGSEQGSVYVRQLPDSRAQPSPQPEAAFPADASGPPRLPSQLGKAGFGSLAHLQSLPSVAAAALTRIEFSVPV